MTPFLMYLILAVLVGVMVGFFLFIVSSKNSKRKIESEGGVTNELFSIISNLQDGIIMYTPEFKITFFNKAAEEIFNIKSVEVMETVMTPKNTQIPRLKALAQVFFPTLAVSSSRVNEYDRNSQVTELVVGDSGLELRVTNVKLLDEQGRVKGFVKVLYNRTRELQVLKSKTEFVSVAAHQLRTPLTAIQWAAESLLEDNEGFKEQHNKMVEIIWQASKKILGIVDDLLNIAKMEEGRFGYSFKEVELIEFISTLLNSLKERTKDLGIKLFFDKPQSSRIIVQADPARLEMALSNIVDNAIRYNVKGGEVGVLIELLKDKPFVKISVRDTGIGILEDDIKRLFTKFYRGQNAVKVRVEGSGLGLYIVKNIIERHGGKIWVESEINRGTTIHFTLPTDPKFIPLKEKTEIDA
ncbi:MAG: hypothetical protein A3A04_00955 [Candidatus Harrisonbacteria bacterium RIFCSPLOWO2_01_FULL_40_28]|uniref:histidine kinase n=2 Tax=Candidatus Harrisoniibacteriota TaxID=1817905 RepID=A0A1G1ZYZ5_9BACT|nr:MAG: hypothetical protein A3A04_00955 [Candidatus Harrisonbacteria bacterium RIFCSPLOWO2_01_FULL_40_28]OGY69675.1 MAG: hypothetical protein A2586_01595 [Candidatus Harrisonbacteria bacterium RIFOXYD1_FULL_40_9]